MAIKTLPKTSTGSAADELAIWNILKGKGLNDFAVAAVMGNLCAESGLRSDNLQNTGEKALKVTDAQYTDQIDEGKRDFIDGHGYGLAQWTYSSRKKNLLNYAKSVQKSIGDYEMQLEFLWMELNYSSFRSVLTALKAATSVRSASDVFMVQFEAPADQSEKRKKERAEFGMKYYNKYFSAAKPPETPKPTPYTLELTTMRKGCKGDNVKALQQLLIANGYSCGGKGVDGDFGTNTEKALIDYQCEHSLKGDGVAGPATMASLLGVK